MLFWRPHTIAMDGSLVISYYPRTTRDKGRLVIPDHEIYTTLDTLDLRSRSKHESHESAPLAERLTWQRLDTISDRVLYLTLLKEQGHTAQIHRQYER